MNTAKRIWFSFVIGWSIKLIPLLIHALFENQFTAVFAVITNIDAVIGVGLSSKFGGTGLMGYNSGGEPIYEGTPILIIFAIVGFLIGFIIYPVIIFVILTIWQRFISRKNIEI